MALEQGVLNFDDQEESTFSWERIPEKDKQNFIRIYAELIEKTQRKIRND